jgi:hypothetical protein
LYILIFMFLIWMGKTKGFGLNNSKHSTNLMYSWFHHETLWHSVLELFTGPRVSVSGVSLIILSVCLLHIARRTKPKRSEAKQTDSIWKRNLG